MSEVFNNVIQKRKRQHKDLESMSAPNFIIQELGIYTGSLVGLVGTGAAGKSFFAMYLSVCVSGGLPLFGQYSVAKCKVAHVDLEMDPDSIDRRYIRIRNGIINDSADLNFIKDVENAESEIDEYRLSIKIDDFSDGRTAEGVIEYYSNVFKSEGYKFVIIDSLIRTTIKDENSAEMASLMRILKEIAVRADCCIMVLHHKGKGKGGSEQTGRGSSSIYDGFDVQIDLDLVGDMKIPTPNRPRKLHGAKSRDYGLHHDIYYLMTDSCDIVPGFFKSRSIYFELCAAPEVQKEAAKVKKQEETIMTDAQKICELLRVNKKLNTRALIDSCAAVKISRARLDKAIDELGEKLIVTPGSNSQKFYSVKEV